MKDESKSKAQLIGELNDLRMRVKELEEPALSGEKTGKMPIMEKEEDRFDSRKLKILMGQIIQAISVIVEKRDPFTAGHQRRVADLACAIAGVMNPDRIFMDGIRMAGMIHDLGKISVPAEIMCKPGSLSEVEFAVVKTHCRTGYEILKTIDFPWPVAQVAHQHHERMNGSGYPQGLSGDEILLEARIIGVADVVEAMTSRRTYRPALGIDKALEEISRKKGTLYDSRVVFACLKVFKEKNFSWDSF